MGAAGAGIGPGGLCAQCQLGGDCRPGSNCQPNPASGQHTCVGIPRAAGYFNPYTCGDHTLAQCICIAHACAPGIHCYRHCPKLPGAGRAYRAQPA